MAPTIVNKADRKTTRTEARAERFVEWMKSQPSRPRHVFTEALSADELETVVDIWWRYAERDPGGGGSRVLGPLGGRPLPIDDMPDEDLGPWIRLTRRLMRAPERGTRYAHRDSLQSRIGQIARHMLADPAAEAEAEVEALRRWVASAEMPAAVLGSKLLYDDLQEGGLIIEDVAVLGFCLWRIAESGGGEATVSTQGPGRLRTALGMSGSGFSAKDSIETLTAAEYINSDPQGQGIWSVILEERSYAAIAQAKRWAELVVEARAKQKAAS